MQRNFFVASDICKALKALICYYFLLYIKLLMAFFLIDANITPAHPHPHNGARIRREVNLGTERPKRKRKKSKACTDPRWGGERGDQETWDQFSHCWPSGGTIGPRLLGFRMVNGLRLTVLKLV